MGFQRDNVLTPEERAVSARKCLNLLAEVTPQDMNETKANFIRNQRAASKRVDYAPTEPQLQWLRDLVEKHCL